MIALPVALDSSLPGQGVRWVTVRLPVCDCPRALGARGETSRVTESVKVQARPGLTAFKKKWARMVTAEPPSPATRA